jgi:hypothetical protein
MCVNVVRMLRCGEWTPSVRLSSSVKGQHFGFSWVVPVEMRGARNPETSSCLPLQVGYQEYLVLQV